MTRPEVSPFADGLRMTADELEDRAKWLRVAADNEQHEWEDHGDVADVARARDEARALARSLFAAADGSPDVLAAVIADALAAFERWDDEGGAA